jgi:hypothetical protein
MMQPSRIPGIPDMVGRLFGSMDLLGFWIWRRHHGGIFSAQAARYGQPQIHVRVKGSTKAGVSAECTITSSSQQLFQLDVLKAKDPVVCSSLAPVPLKRVAVSLNDWVAAKFTLKYPMWLYIGMIRYLISLVVEISPGGIRHPVKQRVIALSIRSIMVSPRMTGRLRPRSRSCFHPLKKMSARLWEEKAARDLRKVWTHCEGLVCLREHGRAWVQIQLAAVEIATIKWSPESRNSTRKRRRRGIGSVGTRFQVIAWSQASNHPMATGEDRRLRIEFVPRRRQSVDPGISNVASFRQIELGHKNLQSILHHSSVQVLWRMCLACCVSFLP